MWDLKKRPLVKSEIQEQITSISVKYAEEFGHYLATKDEGSVPLTTSQLRKFFGEVKRQQMMGYNETEFIMLKPKLAYAVGRAKKNGKCGKIQDFYEVISSAIDLVSSASDKERAFRNFIIFFEAVVAYHKAAE